jgi:hypothetical protein
LQLNPIRLFRVSRVSLNILKIIANL